MQVQERIGKDFHGSDKLSACGPPDLITDVGLQFLQLFATIRNNES